MSTSESAKVTVELTLSTVGDGELPGDKELQETLWGSNFEDLLVENGCVPTQVLGISILGRSGYLDDDGPGIFLTAEEQGDREHPVPQPPQRRLRRTARNHRTTARQTRAVVKREKRGQLSLERERRLQQIRELKAKLQTIPTTNLQWEDNDEPQRGRNTTHH